MKFIELINIIVDNKVLQFKDVKGDSVLQHLYIQLQRLILTFSETNSIYFKYNGKYFFFVTDVNCFYYAGDKKIKNKFYFQLF